MSLYIGIDIGGTTLKGVVIDEKGKLYGEGSVPTAKGEEIAEGVILLFNKLSAGYEGKIKGMGIGCAGVIDSAERHGRAGEQFTAEKFPARENRGGEVRRSRQNHQRRQRGGAGRSEVRRGQNL